MNLHYQKYYQNLIKVLIIYRYLYEINQFYLAANLAAKDEKEPGEKSIVSEKTASGGAQLRAGAATLCAIEREADVNKKNAYRGFPKKSKNITIERNAGRQNCTGAAPVLEYDLRRNGLYYYRARSYDPIMGRFLQTDPMGYQDSMNLYQAFNMNGINFIDPLGEYFVVPDSDPNKDKILYALAKGALTSQGSSIFWKLFKDSRPINIRSDVKLQITYKWENSRRRIDSLECGLIAKDGPHKFKISQNGYTEVTVLLDFSNIAKASSENVSVINGFGDVDATGITTTYHELRHVATLFKSAPGSGVSWATAYGHAISEDKILPHLASNSNANWSQHGSAQVYGEAVYDQSTSISNQTPINFFGSIVPSESAINSIISMIKRKRKIEEMRPEMNHLQQQIANEAMQQFSGTYSPQPNNPFIIFRLF